MKRNLTYTIALLFSICFLLPNLALAMKEAKSKSVRTSFQSNIPSIPAFWQVEGGLGGGQYRNGTDGEVFVSAPGETDSLSQMKRNTNLFYAIGLQHVQPIHAKLLSAIGVGPMLYYQPGQFRGEVFQFKRSDLNNYTYTYNVNPVNFYLEADLYFKSLCNHHITPYVFIGGGVSFVKMTYNEAVTPAALNVGIPASSALNKHTGWDRVLAYELGLGINVTIHKNMFIGFRYTYQDSNRVGLKGNDIYTPIYARLSNQTGYVLLGYRFV